MVSRFAPSAGLQLAQTCRQFFVDSAETAVGENGDHVSAAQLAGNAGDNGIGIGELPRPSSVALKFGDHGINVETLLRAQARRSA